MTREDIIRMAAEAKYYRYKDGIRIEISKENDTDDQWSMLERFAELVASTERMAILDTIEQLADNRHPMFAKGYHFALDNIQQFIEGRYEK
jgi:hypothetical protein